MSRRPQENLGSIDMVQNDRNDVMFIYTNVFLVVICRLEATLDDTMSNGSFWTMSFRPAFAYSERFEGNKISCIWMLFNSFP